MPHMNTTSLLRNWAVYIFDWVAYIFEFTWSYPEWVISHKNKAGMWNNVIGLHLRNSVISLHLHAPDQSRHITNTHHGTYESHITAHMCVERCHESTSECPTSCHVCMWSCHVCMWSCHVGMWKSVITRHLYATNESCHIWTRRVLWLGECQ